jgi:hypothetical protein
MIAASDEQVDGTRHLLLAVGGGVAAIASTGCGGGAGSADRVAACSQTVASSLVSGLSSAPGANPEQSKLNEYVSAAHGLCADAVEQGVVDGSGTIDEREAPALYRRHWNEIFAPLCRRLPELVRATLPPDTLRYVTSADLETRNGYVYIDGRQLSEPYITANVRDRRTYPPRRIPQGTYFLMGDNRKTSCDSREWGPAKSAALIGPVIVTYWPVRRLSVR